MGGLVQAANSKAVGFVGKLGDLLRKNCTDVVLEQPTRIAIQDGRVIQRVTATFFLTHQGHWQGVFHMPPSLDALPDVYFDTLALSIKVLLLVGDAGAINTGNY